MKFSTQIFGKHSFLPPQKVALFMQKIRIISAMDIISVTTRIIIVAWFPIDADVFQERPP